MVKSTKHHERFSATGWPVFTANQTDIRIALCKRALCPDRSLIIKFKNCYESEGQIKEFCKTRFTSEDDFSENARDLAQLGWGGRFLTPKSALEGAFYPFVRCVKRVRPIDSGIIWIGTKHEYPRIYVDNLAANWLCPYSKGGLVMVEPFEPIYRVIENWARLSDRRLYPCLSLPPTPDL